MEFGKAIVDNHADFDLSAGQALGEAVRAVAHLRCAVHDLLAQLLADACFSVQRTRDGRGRNLKFLSNIVYGCSLFGHKDSHLTNASCYEVFYHS